MPVALTKHETAKLRRRSHRLSLRPQSRDGEAACDSTATRNKNAAVVWPTAASILARITAETVEPKAHAYAQRRATAVRKQNTTRWPPRLVARRYWPATYALVA
ncbi:MAG: hypothetical protein DCC67_10795 [Planctomycetota bacterium]|nr:MAG: hypothetical protein DCC67_10795 [Planctomycetota bacterium]